MGLTDTPGSKRKRGRPPTAKPQMDTLTVRLRNDLVERIEDYLGRVKDDAPLRSMEITRADVIRHLLEVGLAAEEKRFGEKRREEVREQKD